MLFAYGSCGNSMMLFRPMCFSCIRFPPIVAVSLRRVGGVLAHRGLPDHSQDLSCLPSLSDPELPWGSHLFVLRRVPRVESGRGQGASCPPKTQKRSRSERLRVSPVTSRAPRDPQLPEGSLGEVVEWRRQRPRRRILCGRGVAPIAAKGRRPWI